MESIVDFLAFQNPNVRYVVIGMIILGACSGFVGSFAFLRKRSLIGDAIAHSVLPGVCLAFILFESKNPLILLAGAFVTGWLSLLMIDWITARSRIKPDAAIGLVLSVFFGIGVLLLTSIQKSGSAGQAGLDKFLFGNAASLILQDIITFGSISLLIFLTIFFFYKEFKIIAFDREYAQTIGLPVRRLEILLATLTVLTVSVGIQAVGVVLMAAMLITPATAASYWTRSLKYMLISAGSFGAIAGIAGAYISYTAPGMPTGPWIIVIVSVLAVLSMLVAPNRGFISRQLTLARNRRKILQENMLKMFYQLGEKLQDFDALRTIPELAQKRKIPKKRMLKGLKALERKKLLEKEGSGWMLTDEGLKESQRIVRIHRLWELYLNTYLNIAPDHVHEDAEAIEHIITPEIEERLEELLRHPHVDPHLTQIPYLKESR